MAYEQRDGDISVFLEADKRNEKAPDWKGKAVLDGKTYEVAFWAKGGRGTMLAGSIKPAREQQRQDDQPFRGGDRTGGGDPGGFSGNDGFGSDSDIPF